MEKRRFLVKARDNAGKIHNLHCSRHIKASEESEIEKIFRNLDAIRNWEFISVEEINRGPLKQGVLSPDAYSFGALKTLNGSRRR